MSDDDLPAIGGEFNIDDILRAVPPKEPAEVPSPTDVDEFVDLDELPGVGELVDPYEVETLGARIEDEPAGNVGERVQEEPAGNVGARIEDEPAGNVGERVHDKPKEPVGPTVDKPNKTKLKRPVKPRGPSRKLPWAWIAAGLGMVACLGVGGYFWDQANQAEARARAAIAAAAKNNTGQTALQTQKLIDEATKVANDKAQTALDDQRKLARKDRDTAVATTEEMVRKEGAAKLEAAQKKFEKAAELTAAQLKTAEEAREAAKQESQAAEAKRQAAEKQRQEAEARIITVAAGRSPEILAELAAKAGPAEAATLYHEAAELYAQSGKPADAAALARKTRQAARDAKDASLEAKALLLLIDLRKNDGPEGRAEAIRAGEEGQAIENLEPRLRNQLSSKTRRLGVGSAARPSNPASPHGAAVSPRGIPLIRVALQAPAADPQPPKELLDARNEVDKLLADESNAAPWAYVEKAEVTLQIAEFYEHSKKYERVRPLAEAVLEATELGIRSVRRLPAEEQVAYSTRTELEELDKAQDSARALLRRLPLPTDLAAKLKTVEAERARLLKGVGALEPALKPGDDPLVWAKGITDRMHGLEATTTTLRASIDALQRSDDRLAHLAETIARRPREPGAPLLSDAPPTPSQRREGKGERAAAWDASLLAAVDAALNDRRTFRTERDEAKVALGQAEQQRDAATASLAQAEAKYADRAAWIDTAEQVAGVVNYTPTAPPSAGAGVESVATKDWRDGLVSKVGKAIPVVPPPPSVVVERHAWNEYGAGIQLLRDSSPEAAVTAFAEAVRFDPKQARYQYFLALAYHMSGRYAEADEAAGRGYRLDRAAHSRLTYLDVDLAPFQGESRTWLESYRKTGHGPQQVQVVVK